MADVAQVLSFSAPQFNQQKVVLQGSQQVTIPSLTTATVVSVPTGLTTVPAFRVFVQYNGNMYPLWWASSFYNTAFNFYPAAGIDAAFNFFIRTYDLAGGTPQITFYWRIYADSKP